MQRTLSSHGNFSNVSLLTCANTVAHAHAPSNTEQYTPPLQLNRKKVNDHHTHISQIHFLAFAYSFAPFSLQQKSRRGNAEYT